MVCRFVAWLVKSRTVIDVSQADCNDKLAVKQEEIEAWQSKDRWVLHHPPSPSTTAPLYPPLESLLGIVSIVNGLPFGGVQAVCRVVDDLLLLLLLLLLLWLSLLWLTTFPGISLLPSTKWCLSLTPAKQHC